MITSDQRTNLIDLAFDWYRLNGFPYLSMRDFDLWQEFYKLCSCSLKEKDKYLEISTIGISIINYFHKHIFNSHAFGMKAPINSYFDDKLLRKSIELALDTTKKITNTSVLNKLKIVSGTQMCSNFRPTIAKFIYDKYGGDGFKILDPCTGYGGRLLGFMASKHILDEYVGVDPVTVTCNKNLQMSRFFQYQDKVMLFNRPFEDISLDCNYFNLAFTSPPYFKKEIYSNDETQSCNRYPDYHNWLMGFWHKTIDKVFHYLKPNGVFVINIQDISISNKNYPLIDDTLNYACKRKFMKEDELYMKFSGFGSNLKKFKVEHIFILRKQ